MNNYQVRVKKFTDLELLRVCNEATSGKPSSQLLESAYRSEHSTIRSQMFKIDMYDIPSFVSVHLVRHQIGITHYVRSNRIDRGGDPCANRCTPVNHSMILNAQAIINIMRKRLCYKASPETRQICKTIKEYIGKVDPDLHKFLVPECVYRNGLCPEPVTCGKIKLQMQRYSFYKEWFKEENRG